MNINTLYSAKNRQATWLELFFDLVFVAVIGVIAHALAHTHDNHISAQQLFSFFMVFVPIWWIWATHTLYSNRFDDDSNKQKFLTLSLMGLVVVLMTFTQGTLESGFTGFVVSYSLMRIVQAYMYFSAPKGNEVASLLALRMAQTIGFGVLVSLSSLLVESELRFILFYLGILIEISSQLRLKHLAKRFPVHRKHLAERIGLLAIIVLGETVISIIGTFSAKSSFDGLDILAAVTGFLLIAQIWWIFFGSLHRLELAKKIETGHTMIFSHLFFYVGLIFLANLVRHSIIGDLDRETFALMGIAGMTLFYLGKQIPYIRAFPPYRNGIILNSVLCIAVTAVAALLPKIEYSLVAMSVGLFLYVQLNVRWLIPKFDVSDYLEQE